MRNQRYAPRRASRSHGSSLRPDKGTESAAALIAVAIISLMGIGIFVWSSHRPKQPDVDLLVGADISGSIGHAGRQQYFGMLDEIVDQVLPRHSDVMMWSYDVNAHKYADKRPQDSRDLWPVEDEIIAAKSPTQGTYPSVVIQRMLAAAQTADRDDRSVALLLLTDGEDEDPATTLRVMTKIAEIPAVRAVWICGATSSNGFRSVVEKRYGPLLKDRLIVTSANDAQDGLGRFRVAVEK